MQSISVEQQLDMDIMKHQVDDGSHGVILKLTKMKGMTWKPKFECLKFDLYDRLAEEKIVKCKFFISSLLP